MPPLQLGSPGLMPLLLHLPGYLQGVRCAVPCVSGGGCVGAWARGHVGAWVCEYVRAWVRCALNAVRVGCGSTQACEHVCTCACNAHHDGRAVDDGGRPREDGAVVVVPGRPTPPRASPPPQHGVGVSRHVHGHGAARHGVHEAKSRRAPACGHRVATSRLRWRRRAMSRRGEDISGAAARGRLGAAHRSFQMATGSWAQCRKSLDTQWPQSGPDIDHKAGRCSNMFMQRVGRLDCVCLPSRAHARASPWGINTRVVGQLTESRNHAALNPCCRSLARRHPRRPCPQRCGSGKSCGTACAPARTRSGGAIGRRRGKGASARSVQCGGRSGLLVGKRAAARGRARLCRRRAAKRRRSLGMAAGRKVRQPRRRTTGGCHARRSTAYIAPTHRVVHRPVGVVDVTRWVCLPKRRRATPKDTQACDHERTVY